MPAVPAIERLAGEALVILIHLAAALAHIREGNAQAAARTLTELVRSAPRGTYGDEALYWRARLAEAQPEREGIASAAQDYFALLRRLPEGRRRRQVRVRLTALGEPGRVLTPEEAREMSRRLLGRIGRALHDHAADNKGSLPDALEDLLDEYVRDAAVLVRPGRYEDGGGRPYGYAPGLRATLKQPVERAAALAGSVGGVPIVVWEPVPSADGRRLVLRLDGEVRSVQDVGAQSGPAE